jgi:uncharacterized protein (DUF1810 family)
MKGAVTMAGKSLERFRRAQDQPGAGFPEALEEIRAGRKQGHWIWYVLPQLEGLGSSSMSQAYGIRGEEEAREYLNDPELFSRLIAITEAIAERLEGGKGVPLERLMGSHIDVLKLVSSLTLFSRVAAKLPPSGGRARLAALAADVLKVAESAGYPPCSVTLERLETTG